MLKKLLHFILVSATLFFAFSSNASAQSCGDLYTVGNCREAGGCAIGSMCKADGIWPFHWNYRCEVDSRCIAPIQPPINTTANCGLERSVNGVTGCFADDNGLIENGLNCQGGGSMCCRQASMCPAATDKPTGCGILTNGGSTCRINGSDTGGFQRCGQTQACCNGQVCPQLPKLGCGEETEFSDQQCGCTTGLQPNGTKFCCGWLDNGSCRRSDPEGGVDKTPLPTPTPSGGGGGGGGGGGFDGEEEDTTPPLNIFEGPTSANFKALNPLEMFGNEDSKKLTSPGAIVSRMLLFAFPLAGLILFIMIVWGGFEMISSAASKGIEAGKQRITAAIVGFVLLFVAYWVFQIIEVIFGVAIL